MTASCVVLPSGCIQCPAVQGSPRIPAHFEYTPARGWNAGANSIAVIESSAQRVRWSVGQSVGIICGLARYPRALPSDPTSIDFGIYSFTSPSGLTRLVQPIELGILKSSPVTRPSDAVMMVRRAGGRITYWLDDVLIYTSETPSAGTLCVGSAYYASGDSIL